MNKKETSSERVLRGIEGRIQEWRARMGARETELHAQREALWTEMAEREKLLAQSATAEGEARERSLEEAAREHRAVFVAHSEEAGRALERFAEQDLRLVSVVSGSEQRGADIKGSWLVFEQER